MDTNDRQTFFTRMKNHAPRRLRQLAFPLFGLAALVWFILRVLPKPSRASYPCQRVAFPIASGFVIWLTGLFSSAYLFKRINALCHQTRWGWAIVLMLASLVTTIVTLVHTPQNEAFALNVTPNAPIGDAKGINPGRVVWTHNPNATDWAGFDSEEHWYEPEHTDLAVVESMFSRTLQALTSTTNDINAWDALFRYSNQQQGHGDMGYQLGQNITIKLNLVTSKGSDVVDISTYEKDPAVLNRGDVAPQMVTTLLRHLVDIVGVPQTNIFIGDPTAFVPNHFWDVWHPEFPDIHFLDNQGLLGRTRVEFSDVPFYWSTPDADGKLQDYLPISYVNADHFINFAVLKGHARGGVTLCAKNHYGTLIRTPIGDLREAKGLDYYNLHESLPSESPGTAKYRPLVDLMGHPDIGGKTMLYLIDGLYGGTDWDCHAYKWTSPSFGDGVNGDWPSSLFASQDPVAIDSVALDFLLAEWPDIVGKGSLQGGATDYLVEAALADAPPSGTFYDPDGNGVRMLSLGTHEHWNNAYQKQYSRNLGTGNGIELIQLDDARLLLAASTSASTTDHQLTLTNLLPNATYEILQATTLDDAVWTSAHTLIATAVSTNWQHAANDDWTTLYYKIKQIAATHNLLQNSSFEDMGTTVTEAYAWEDNIIGGNWGSAKRENWKHYSGDQSAVVVGDGTTQGGFWQTVPVHAGATYQCAAAFYKESGWSASEVDLKIEWYNNIHQKTDEVVLSLLDLPFDQWTQRSLMATAPNGTESAHIVLNVSGMNPGNSLYMDAIYFGK